MLKKKLLLNSEQTRIVTAQKELSSLTSNLNSRMASELNTARSSAGIGPGGDLKNTQPINVMHNEYEKLHGISVENSPKHDDVNSNLVNTINDPINAHAARLLTEREALMATGAYSTEDLVIKQLDNRIKEAL